MTTEVQLTNDPQRAEDTLIDQKNGEHDPAIAFARRKAMYLRNQGYKDYAAIAVLRKGRRLVLVCRNGDVRWLPTTNGTHFPRKKRGEV